MQSAIWIQGEIIRQMPRTRHLRRVGRSVQTIIARMALIVISRLLNRKLLTSTLVILKLVEGKEVEWK
jgi:hypothetical protein